MSRGADRHCRAVAFRDFAARQQGANSALRFARRVFSHFPSGRRGHCRADSIKTDYAHVRRIAKAFRVGQRRYVVAAQDRRRHNGSSRTISAVTDDELRDQTLVSAAGSRGQALDDILPKLRPRPRSRRPHARQRHYDVQMIGHRLPALDSRDAHRQGKTMVATLAVSERVEGRASWASSQ